MLNIGFPFGLSKNRIKDYIKLINILDIKTYEGLNYVFFYDCLTELAKHYLINQSINQKIGEGKFFCNKELILEKKTNLYEKFNFE